MIAIKDELMETYDVIITGAGPAGLSLASELSKYFKILVIEKGKIGYTNKSWISYEDRIKKLGFPKKVIVNKFHKWHFECRGEYWTIEDHFVALNEKAILEYWINICKKNSVVLLSNCGFINFKKKKDSIIINDKFKARLLVDCCGIDSPIVRKKNLIQNIVYMNCFGGYIKTKKKEENYYKVPLKANGIIHNFGITRLNNSIYFALYFMYSENKLNLSKYKSKFNRMYKKLLDKEGKVIEYKIGRYGSGQLKKHTLDYVYLFGDACLLSPGFIGMGFNEILRQYKAVSRHLRKCLNNNTLNQEQLQTPASILEDAESVLFRIISQTINAFDLDEVKMLFKYARQMDKKVNARMFRNTMSKKDIIKYLKAFLTKIELERIIKKIPKKYVIALIKEILKLSKDLLSEEIHDLVYKHHKIKIKDII